MPVLKAQRLKLEERLSVQDKERLAELRKELRGAWKKDADRQPEREKLLLEASAMAYRYYESIQVLLQEIAPQREQWRNHIKETIDQSRTGERRHPRAGKHRLERLFSAVGFLLLDPKDDNFLPTDSSSVRLYPNPAVDRVFVEYQLDHSTQVTIEVYNLRGDLVKSQTVEQVAGRYTHELGSLPKGEYVVKVTYGSNTHHRKLIVQ